MHMVHDLGGCDDSDNSNANDETNPTLLSGSACRNNCFLDMVQSIGVKIVQQTKCRTATLFQVDLDGIDRLMLLFHKYAHLIYD